MRALICGISGQDGAYLARLLLDKGYSVAGTSRDIRGSQRGSLATLGILEQVRLVSMATAEPQNVLDVLRDVGADEIYNLSGQSSVGLSFQQPAETLASIVSANLNILEGMRQLGKPARYFNAGSGEIFGATSPAGAGEDHPVNPQSPYAVAKAAAFWLVANYRAAYGLHASTGILFNHESPLRPNRFVTRKITAAACRISQGSGEKLTLGNMDIRRDWGWAPEYVEAMWQMLQQPAPADYVIATGVTHSLEEFVSAAFAAVHLDWRDHTEISPALFRPTDVAEMKGDPRRIAAALGWKARTGMHGAVERMIKAELEVPK
jgi:GDPmannose 4,6-dehydratase